MTFTPALFSVSYSGSWGQALLGVEDFLDKAHTLGFRGVMLGGKRPHLNPLDWDDKARARLAKRIQQHGFEHVCVAGYNNFTGDLEHAEVPMREIQVQHVVELVRLTRDIGGSLVRVFTGYQHPAGGYLAQRDLVIDCLTECAQRAAEFGVDIGVQNHHDIGVDWRSQKDLIDAVGQPNCKPLLDAWSPSLQGANLIDAAGALGPLCPQTTIADYQQRPRFRYDPEVINYAAELPYSQAVPMGEGFIDYRAFLTAMSQAGFGGATVYEMCSPLLGGGSEENLDRHATRFLEFVADLE